MCQHFFSNIHILKIITDLSEYSSSKKTFVTIGTFDGFHIGHKKVLRNLVEQAKKKEAVSILLTFFPHPRMVLNNDSSIELLNTIDERIELLKESGIDVLIIHKFSPAFAKQSALTFVRDVLVQKLNISKLFIGYDHHFGKNREGSFEQLKELGNTYGFKVKKIAQKDIADVVVSSTKIRKALKKGAIEQANSFLGYCYRLNGIVVKGKNLGEKIGFPTANLQIEETYKLIPKNGAYLVRTYIENVPYHGMMNIGYRPTVDGKNKTIEIHIFNLNTNLYGKKLQIEILSFMRDEQKFSSISELKKQLVQDKEKSYLLLEILGAN